MPTATARRQFSGRLPLTVGPARNARFLARWTASICAGDGRYRR